ncbi:OmpA family protein [Marinomonas sp. A79]|uniref:OmpA family protein n=1 Tax=Marinomonas vulgaris TaxID=2823372 RepID=A0ABS5H7P9_9GAMM|nr:OmpA family protein [Marinomonas vulgaris]MBR7887475.1 OmpA family protein [Marinomonas vulgaris]
MSIFIKTLSTLTIFLTLSGSIAAESLYSNNPQSRIMDSDTDGVIDARDVCANTIPGTAVDNYGCNKITEKRLTVQLNVLFDSGDAQVKPRFYSELRKLAVFLQDNPATSAVIEGHTDNTGSNEANRSLSQQRADAIADVLVDSFRIHQHRIKGIGYGENNPVDTNETETGRKNNRRVVAEVFAKQQSQPQRWTVFSVDKNQNVALNNQY